MHLCTEQTPVWECGHPGNVFSPLVMSQHDRKHSGSLQINTGTTKRSLASREPQNIADNNLAGRRKKTQNKQSLYQCEAMWTHGGKWGARPRITPHEQRGMRHPAFTRRIAPKFTHNKLLCGNYRACPAAAITAGLSPANLERNLARCVITITH